MSNDFELKSGKLLSTRAFESDDLDNLVTFFEELRGDSMRFAIPQYYDRARLERLTANLHRDLILLALDGVRIVGVAAIYGSSLPWLKGHGEFMTYIREGYQNQGLGTYLTRSILEKAKRKGYHKVTLEVVAENLSAIKAYKKAGFVVEGRLREDHFGDDESYHDVLIMGIIL